MRIDLYTRTVLTAIAVCLLWLCVILTPAGTAVSAQATTGGSAQTPASPPVQEVMIVGIKHPGYKPRASALEPAQINGSWDPLAAYNTQPPAPPR
jgi:hypothetical protein